MGGNGKGEEGEIKRGGEGMEARGLAPQNFLTRTATASFYTVFFESFQYKFLYSISNLFSCSFYTVFFISFQFKFYIVF
jgi:hypothetical protein